MNWSGSISSRFHTFQEPYFLDSPSLCCSKLEFFNEKFERQKWGEIILSVGHGKHMYRQLRNLQWLLQLLEEPVLLSEGETVGGRFATKPENCYSSPENIWEPLALGWVFPWPSGFLVFIFSDHDHIWEGTHLTTTFLYSYNLYSDFGLMTKSGLRQVGKVPRGVDLGRQDQKFSSEYGLFETSFCGNV